MLVSNICFLYLYIFVGILPKRKDGSENILTKLQSVIDGFDSKSNDKGIICNLLKYNFILILYIKIYFVIL